MERIQDSISTTPDEMYTLLKDNLGAQCNPRYTSGGKINHGHTGQEQRNNTSLIFYLSSGTTIGESENDENGKSLDLSCGFDMDLSLVCLHACVTPGSIYAVDGPCDS